MKKPYHKDTKGTKTDTKGMRGRRAASLSTLWLSLCPLCLCGGVFQSTSAPAQSEFDCASKSARHCRGARSRLDYRSPATREKEFPKTHAQDARRPARTSPQSGLSDQAERFGRHRPRSARTLDAAGPLARRDDLVGREPLSPRTARRAPLRRRGDRVRPRLDAVHRGGDLGRHAVPRGTEVPAVRRGDRPPGAVPLGRDDGRDGGPGAGRAGRRERGGLAVLHAPRRRPPRRRCTRSTAACGSPARSARTSLSSRFVVAAGDEDRLWARDVLAGVARAPGHPEPRRRAGRRSAGRRGISPRSRGGRSRSAGRGWSRSARTRTAR